MPSFTEDQLAGLFKMVPFSVRDEKLLNVGQSRANHKYPKSSIQYQEPMGDEPFECSVELFFHGTFYKERFRLFEKAIRDPAPGRLFLPTFGIFNSIVALPATFTSNQKTLGEITATVVFSETTIKPSPISSNISLHDVVRIAQFARGVLLTALSTSFVAPKTSNNLTTILADITALAKGVQKVTKKNRETTVFLRKVNAEVNNPIGLANLLLSPVEPLGYLQSLALSFGDQIIESTTQEQAIIETQTTESIVPASNSVEAGFTILTTVSTLGNSLSDSMNDLDAGILLERPTSAPATPESSELNTDIAVWDATTGEREDRNISRVALVEVFRLVGLIGMFEFASQKNYTTTEEIDSDLKKLEQYYEALVENNDSLIVTKTKASLDELRNLADAVLETKKQQSYTVTTVNIVRPRSAFLIAYDLYGEYLQSDVQHEYMANLIAGLNRSQARNRMQGEVKVVEIGR